MPQRYDIVIVRNECSIKDIAAWHDGSNWDGYYCKKGDTFSFWKSIDAECKMDKKIKKIQKNTKTLLKEEKDLLKEDKKRDKVCEMGEKMMKKNGKK